MSSSIKEFGAPLGWTPKSLITWNGHFLPYAFRWDDMRFDLGRGELPDFSIVELDLISGESKSWDSFSEAERFYGFRQGTIGDYMRKGLLIKDKKFFYVKKNPPSKAKIERLRQMATIACSFNINHVEEA